MSPQISMRLAMFLNADANEILFCLHHKDGQLAQMSGSPAVRPGTLVCQTWNEAESFRTKVIGSRRGQAKMWKVVSISVEKLLKHHRLCFRFADGAGSSTYAMLGPQGTA